MSIPSFVKDAFRSTTSLENDHILMHATYLVACSGNFQKVYEIAHQTFIKNKGFVQNVSLCVSLSVRVYNVMVFLCPGEKLPLVYYYR